MVDFYTQLLLERQSWNPTPIPNEPLLDNGEYGIKEAMARSLAISKALELDVGAFIGSACKSELKLPPGAIALLKSNIKDETIHDRQFQLAIDTYPIATSITQEAANIAHWWRVHPDHMLTKAKELEIGLFLITQAIIRFFGGQALDRMASDISMDEWRHVATNCSVCEELQLETSPSLDRLRIDTLEWVTKGLSKRGQDSNFWRRQSDSMVSDREAPEMEALFNWVPRVSFFECSNERISFYG